MTPIERARDAAREAMSQSLSDEAAYIMGSGEYQCDAAIAAYEANLSAQGLVIVPREATTIMWNAGDDLMPSLEELERRLPLEDVFYEVIPGPGKVYAAMIAASEAEKG